MPLFGVAMILVLMDVSTVNSLCFRRAVSAPMGTTARAATACRRHPPHAVGARARRSYAQRGLRRTRQYTSPIDQPPACFSSSQKWART